MTTPTLIADLERAERGSRELDRRIAFSIQWRPDSPSFREHEAKHDYATAWIAHAPWHGDWLIPRYTESLDAALTLLPEGLEGWWRQVTANSGLASVSIGPMGHLQFAKKSKKKYNGYVTNGEHKEARATCIAYMRARKDME